MCSIIKLNYFDTSRGWQVIKTVTRLDSLITDRMVVKLNFFRALNSEAEKEVRKFNHSGVSTFPEAKRTIVSVPNKRN